MYKSSKTYTHAVGLSCCFRQHRARSHCNLLHGYALEVKFEFVTPSLDETNWVMDFGGFKDLKAWLEDTFDHTLLVAHDDPLFSHLVYLGKLGLAKVIAVEATGCEAFAWMIFEYASAWLTQKLAYPRVKLSSVEVREHGANSATYYDPAV